MIKTISVLFSYVAFLLLGLFTSDTVLIENNTPAMIAPGVKSEVSVNVRKGDVQGFSKLELTLPDGFIATPGEIKGASFTFSGDKAKFVWMNLPEEEMFTITYFIESEPGVQGAYEIKGTFSYVKQNKREDAYIPTRTIVVKQDAPTGVEAALAEAPTVRVEAPVLEMTCERRIERLSDNEYLVRLKVNNNKIVGFGKILEILPDNCNTNRDNDGGAVITQDANSIKFVWFEVPVAPTFEVSYRVMCISDGTVPVIRGQVSYTENGNPFTVDVVQMEAPADLSIVAANQNNTTASDSSAAVVNAAGDTQTTSAADSSNQASVNTSGDIQTTTAGDGNTTQQSGDTNVAANTQSGQQTGNNTADTGNNQQANSATTVTTDTAQTTQVSGNMQQSNVVNGGVKEQKSDVNNTKSDNVSATADNTKVSVKSVPSAEKGITYKVQILAAHRVVDKTYLKKKFSFDQEYNIENHNGWIKYTAGSYAQYKDARDARVRITNASSKLPGPFVTAYNDGERITVQEALLVSKQLWYK
ncbi:MAG: hypothetical protein ACK478_02920 [Flavobacteriales bacterium]